MSKINNTVVDNAEYLHIVVLMYNLLEHSLNYSDTTDSLWFYSKDEAANFDNSIPYLKNFKSFTYKTELAGQTEAANRTLENTTIPAPLKYLRNF